MPKEFRLCSKAELATLRLEAAYVALGQAGKAASGVVTSALLSGISGIITEFIGATFLFLYRSTIQQATNHIKTLERINSVGMAVKILDTISVDSKKLQYETKAEIVKSLLNQAGKIN